MSPNTCQLAYTHTRKLALMEKRNYLQHSCKHLITDTSHMQQIQPVLETYSQPQYGTRLKGPSVTQVFTYNNKGTHVHCTTTTTTTTTVLRPFFRDHPGEPVPEENFWTLWCKGRLTEADTETIRLGATPSGLTSAHLYHPPFFTGRMPFLPPNRQYQSTEGN